MTTDEYLHHDGDMEEDIELSPLEEEDYSEDSFVIEYSHHEIPSTEAEEIIKKERVPWIKKAFSEESVPEEDIEYYQKEDGTTVHVLNGVEELVQVTRKRGNSVILNTVLSWLVYLILIFAFYLFWNGHNAPGGGFIAGLMTAAVAVLFYVSFGSRFIQTTLHYDFKYLIAIGLSVSLCCGMGGMLFGYPFLTHTFGNFNIPLFGELELATATIFDLGVYLTVTGGCVTIITSIGESGNKKRPSTVAEEATEVAHDDMSLDR